MKGGKGGEGGRREDGGKERREKLPCTHMISIQYCIIG